MATSVGDGQLVEPTPAPRVRAMRGKGRRRQQIPEDILNDPALAEAAGALPANYNFEIHKTVWRLRQARAKRVALQLPEGLLMFACVLADIVQSFAGAEPVIMGDVTYGACCIDDLSAKELGCDFMVHYGHSCLIPVDVTSPLPVLYVFVEISFDMDHLVQCVVQTLPPHSHIVLAGTIQFGSGLHAAKPLLEEKFASVHVPQASPLSPGEVLGCTSPDLGAHQSQGDDPRALVFVSDGRFHLESLMIHNPTIAAYRYDPYAKHLSREWYEVDRMLDLRQQAITTARGAKRFGLILGTLGRQGNPSIVLRLEALLGRHGRSCFVLLLSEITPPKLALFSESVDAWIQVACPRLSVDWGHAFDKPLLSPYEAEVALDETSWRERYPMDYYASGSGPWTNLHAPRTR